MRKPLLYTAALAFFVYTQWSIWTWLAQHGSFGVAGAHAWDTLMRDPFVLMAWNDMAIFTAIVLVWLWRDLTATGDWLNRLSPGEGRDAAVKRYAAQVFESDPEAALIWAGSLGVAEERTSEVEQLARRYLRNDPARAKRWIAASALPPETREQLLGQGNNR